MNAVKLGDLFLLIGMCVFVALVAFVVLRHIFGNIRTLYGSIPKGERDWFVVGLTAAMVFFGALVGIGVGPLDLPLGPAFRSLFH